MLGLTAMGVVLAWRVMRDEVGKDLGTAEEARKSERSICLLGGD